MAGAVVVELPKLDRLLGRRVLILGEVNTGKTGLLADALQAFLAAGQGGLAVIDMAPPTTEGIGGKLRGVWLDQVRYFSAELTPPRLTGETHQEVMELATRNARRLEQVFDAYLSEPALALFINDVSMYLQAGDPAHLEEVLAASPSVVLNGYYGHSLGGGELGRTERRRMEELMETCDLVIRV